MDAADILTMMKENNIRMADILKADGCFAWTLWEDADVEEHFLSYCEENGIKPDMISIAAKHEIFTTVKENSQKIIEDVACEDGYDALASAMQHAMKNIMPNVMAVK